MSNPIVRYIVAIFLLGLVIIVASFILSFVIAAVLVAALALPVAYIWLRYKAKKQMADMDSDYDDGAIDVEYQIISESDEKK